MNPRLKEREKMKENLISIIMPVYNVEKHLRQSIESVINQTYKELEIILVDDGSKDASGIICDEYAKKDSRIKVIHKQNSGISSTRNVGIDNATGKYIMFIDSDDFFENNSCQLLYEEIERNNADYVIGNYRHTTHEGEKWKYPLFNIDDISNNFKVSIKDYEKSIFVMNSVIWNKIYRRDFIEKNKLRFIEDVLAEDAIFSIFCYTHSDKGYYINDIIYNYRQNDEKMSLSTNCTKEYFLKQNEAYKILFEDFETTENIGFYRYFYARILPYLLSKIIDTNQLKTDDEIIEVLKMFSWYFKQKSEYKVPVAQKMLNEIVDSISNEEYIDALKKIKKLKEERKDMSKSEKEKMYVPTKELYMEVSKY